MRRSFRTRSCFAGWVPRVGTLGWYAMPIQGMGFETGLGHGIGNGSTLRENGIEPDKRRSERRSAPRPGSATHGYKRSEYDTTTQVSLLPDESKWDDDISDPVSAAPAGKCAEASVEIQRAAVMSVRHRSAHRSDIGGAGAGPDSRPGP